MERSLGSLVASKLSFRSASGAEKKVWRDIRSAGQGVGQIDQVMPVHDVVAKLAAEYAAARRRLVLAGREARAPGSYCCGWRAPRSRRSSPARRRPR